MFMAFIRCIQKQCPGEQSGVIGVDFRFNAWGGIYEVDMDRSIGRKILSIAQETRADFQVKPDSLPNQP